MPETVMDVPARSTPQTKARLLTLFCHRASECLTDHLPHGDGLICYSLLSELARRGHRVIAYTNRNGVTNLPGNLDIREQNYKIPANSLGDWELGWRANRLLKKIERTESIDIVWRMHPYDVSSPIIPYTNGRPLVIGPVFPGWPKESAPANDMGKPRFGIGIRGLLNPFAKLGWVRAVRNASLVICATDSFSEKTRGQTNGRVLTLPVIVEPPLNLIHRRVPGPALRFLFAANLYRNKNPQVFCQTIHRLLELGIPTTGEILGDGPERVALEQWCQSNGLKDIVHFSGRIPNAEVYEKLAGADGLISTSLGEPYGRSIAEAMSVGAVPICHRSGGPADFISSNGDGLLVDRMDANDYASTIAAAWKTPGTWQRLSIAACEKATQWTTGIVVNKLEAALQALPQQAVVQ